MNEYEVHIALKISGVHLCPFHLIAILRADRHIVNKNNVYMVGRRSEPGAGGLDGWQGARHHNHNLILHGRRQVLSQVLDQFIVGKKS